MALARQADEAGLDSVWVAEAWGQDAVSVPGHLTTVTERVAICCRPDQIDERLAWYERAGATTLLAMPFGDRAAIVDRLASAVAA